MNLFMQWLRRTTQPATALHPRRFAPRLETLETRNLMSAGFYAIDGTGNNPANLGAAGTDLIRIASAAYADGVTPPGITTRPNARAISNALSDQSDPANPSEDLSVVNQMNLSDYIYIFGQFLDHDLDLTTATGQAFNIPAGSPTDPMGPESFTRSTTNPLTGTSAANPLQQVNAVTSFLDGSQVYGSNLARADSLRTHNGGRLKTGPGGLLPLDNSVNFPNGTIEMANDAHLVPNTQLFAAGDVRANENIELTALQTLFVREHNRIAGQLQAAHRQWNDERLYQEARRIVIAELQIITYTEWLPALLGPGALPAYTGYKSNVDPSIANEFSTAMFRFAHSQLDNDIERLNNNGTESAAGGVDLAEAFYNPTLINAAGITDPITGVVSTGIGAILKGGASADAQEVDVLAVRAIRNFLFGPPGAGGTDLIARDIQRGRDHGLTDYNSMRVAYGLHAVATFADITSDVGVQQKLEQLYGTVDNIDAFVGTIAEDHVPGADVGPLTKAVLVDQFTRLRDGDSLFYLNQFSRQELNNLLATATLSKVIQRNTDISNLQSNAFIYQASISGTVFSAPGGFGRSNFLAQGLAGVTVQLQDDDGNEIATTETDSLGRYSFDNNSGMEGTGYYNISLVVPTGATQTSADPRAILISRGDINVRGVNFFVDLGITSPQTATHFAVFALPTVPSGRPFAVLVVALDASNHVVTGYTGTVRFASSDPNATLPDEYTFVASDNGSHVFTASLATLGRQTLSVTDTLTDSITGSIHARVFAQPWQWRTIPRR